MTATVSRMGRQVVYKAAFLRVGILLAACAFSVGIFLTLSANLYKTGFPLDDAWIHQTYARNLIKFGDWVYVPGQVSAGSTAPLWSALLSIGYLFSQRVPYFWTYLLGTLTLFGVGLSGELAVRQLTNTPAGRLPWVGLFLVTEWHLVWGAVSGMETALFAALILAALVCLVAQRPKYALAGAIIGISCWVRPDGITLLGPALFLILLSSNSWKGKLKDGIILIATFGVLFSAYLVFNYALSGSILPNTFYAKQAEYASMLSTPIWQRLGRLAMLPAVGAGAILIPGFILATVQAVKSRDWKIIALVLWWLGYTTIYALRLPVTYQHGRYLIPAMPVFFILGLTGLIKYFNLSFAANRFAWMLGRLLFISLISLQLVFGFKGATAYAEDVAIIESEMVATAQWLKTHTNSEDVIAVHDIGAIGYFSDRKILDLAGLVSPEIIPFIRDESRLATYLDEQKAAYLVTFPGWYPKLVEGSTLVFQTDSVYSRQSGGENMAVYRWR